LSYSDQSKQFSPSFFTRKIVLRGVELEVEFRFYQAIPSTADEPESPEEVIIEAVYVDDIEISNLIGTKAWDEIEAEILKLYDSKEEV
jgi:hypothetical protein